MKCESASYLPTLPAWSGTIGMTDDAPNSSAAWSLFPTIRRTDKSDFRSGRCKVARSTPRFAQSRALCLPRDACLPLGARGMHAACSFLDNDWVIWPTKPHAGGRKQAVSRKQEQLQSRPMLQKVTRTTRRKNTSKNIIGGYAKTRRHDSKNGRPLDARSRSSRPTPRNLPITFF